MTNGQVPTDILSIERLAVYNCTTGAPLESPADTTPPIINITNLNASDTMRFGYNLNISTFITGSATSVNFTFNVTFPDLYNFSFVTTGTEQWLSQNITINVTRGSVINASVVACDSSSNCAINSTTITIADTPVTFTLGINNTLPRINYDVQLSAGIGDNDTISMVIASWNCSSSGVWINISNITFEANSNTIRSNYSINATIGRVRGNTCGWQFYENDTINTFTVSALNTFVVANTPPNATTISNATDKNTRNNETIGCTALVDADGDTINYVNLFEASKNPPTVVRQNTTASTFITNMTNESVYFARCDTTDGFETTASSLVFNTTLDTTTPTLSSCNAVNGTAYRLNTTVRCTCEDSNVFEVNVTATSLTTNLLTFSNSSINLTPTYTSYTTAIAVNTTWGEGNYNISFWCGDTKNKKLPIEHIKAGSNNIYQQFNDTLTGTQINITFGILLPNDAFLTLQDNEPYFLKGSKLENNLHNNKIEHYKTLYNATLPPLSWLKIIHPLLDFINLRFALQIKTNRQIIEVYDNLEAHLLIGSGKQRISFDAQDLRDMGYTTQFKDIGSAKYIIINPRVDLYVEGTILQLDPRIDNLNIVQNDAEVIIDQTIPTIIAFNISANGTYISNGSYVRSNVINITFNISDRLTGNVTPFTGFVDEVRRKNVTTGFNINSSRNFSISNWTDGNRTINIEVNDSAGNTINSTFLYFIIDTTSPVIVNASNRTTSGSTIITSNDDVNISFYVSEAICLRAINISHNASAGTEINHSFASTGNGTYSMLISRNNLTEGEVVGWKGWAVDCAGNIIDPVYSFIVGGVSAAATTATTGATTGGGGGVIGATRQCKEYAQTFKQCYYFDGISKCLKGCPKNQICSKAYDCEATNITTPLNINPLELTTSVTKIPLLTRFFNWFNGLIGLSTKQALNSPELSIMPITEEQTTEPITQKAGEQIKQAFNTYKWLPYAIVGFVIIGLGIYAFSLWQPALSFLLSLGVWGYIILLIIGIAIYMFLRYF